ncbi:MAG: 50S ribosomal protein L22 [Chitinophagaceae bacterium]|nr:MAG: 50S ribosomal protein L22 [Chitinophagaceae bacterium]
MKAIAKLNNCPTSPRKMRLVIDTIRGEQVEKALGILKFQKKEAARRVEKLLVSAISNWENKNESERIEDHNLIVTEAYVNQGRTLKRLRPAPMGRAHRIRKRSNHVFLAVESSQILAMPPEKPELNENENEIVEENQNTEA